ncbi:MAG TPA: MBL fold metallo-hydrolase [candidate division Zixibacteria bacterium]|nr:MBL fold metallo-hydrolase [candidate division Zixibacteria bacterium]HEQ99148.1 MBL fold metallo-hydrolase [candidate division Zixibacteria bacterium]
MSLQIFPVKVGINTCYLIRHEGVILIDAGGPNKIKTFQRAFDKFSIRPDEIKLIVLTHGDVDHVGSAADLKELTGARIAIHKNDKDLFEKSLHNFPAGVTKWGKFMHVILNPVLKNVLPRISGGKADIILDENDYPLSDFGVQGKIIHTPGHTSGSISVLLDSGDAFVGCMAHNNFPFRLKPGLPIFADDIEGVKQSWKRLLKYDIKTIYPGHGNPFPAEVMRRELGE